MTIPNDHDQDEMEEPGPFHVFLFALVFCLGALTMIAIERLPWWP